MRDIGKKRMAPVGEGNRTCNLAGFGSCGAGDGVADRGLDRAESNADERG